MGRYVMLAAGAVVVFAAVVSVLLELMPLPHRPIDLMIAGAVGTLVSLLVVFLALLGTTIKVSHVFFRKRQK